MRRRSSAPGKIVFDKSFRRRRRRGRPDRRFHVKIGLIRQHTAKHRNIDSHANLYVAVQALPLWRARFFFRQTVR